MLRTIKLSILGALALSVASAGTVVPVDLAGVTLPSGDVSATMSKCTNTATGAGQVCTAPTPSGNTYMSAVFSGPVAVNPPTTSNSNQNVTTGAGQTAFLLANQPSNGDNILNGGGASTDQQIVVDLGGYNPISNPAGGVISVSDIYTMIQSNLASVGSDGLSVTLNGLNSLGQAASYTFLLTEGTDVRGTNSSQTATSTVAGGVSGNVPLSTMQTSGVDSNPGGGNGCLLNGVVTAGCSIDVYNNAFGGYDSGNSLTYYLDVQELVLPTTGNPFANGILQSIVISDDAFAGGNTNEATTVLLGGISLVTPEPATFALFGAGLGLLFLLHKRRQARHTA